MQMQRLRLLFYWVDYEINNNVLWACQCPRSITLKLLHAKRMTGYHLFSHNTWPCENGPSWLHVQEKERKKERDQLFTTSSLPYKFWKANLFLAIRRRYITLPWLTMSLHLYLVYLSIDAKYEAPTRGKGNARYLGKEAPMIQFLLSILIW